MNNITKVSEITASDLAEYMRLDEVDTQDTNTLNNMLGIAKTYIQNYTGVASDKMDDYQDFVIVAFILVQDMWDTRTLYIDKSNVNKAVDSILGMHSINLL
jgi:hypothetical protein